MTKTIKVGRAHEAIVDDEDYERLVVYKWNLQRNQSGVLYAYRRPPGKPRRLFFMHWDILPRVDGYVIDHRNIDGLDNRRCNLRYATKSQNAANSRAGKSKTSAYRGVAWEGLLATRPWKAEIQANGQRLRLGRFTTEQEAAIAYDEVAAKKFGEFARLNLPDEVVR